MRIYRVAAAFVVLIAVAILTACSGTSPLTPSALDPTSSASLSPSSQHAPSNATFAEALAYENSEVRCTWNTSQYVARLTCHNKTSRVLNYGVLTVFWTKDEPGSTRFFDTQEMQPGAAVNIVLQPYELRTFQPNSLPNGCYNGKPKMWQADAHKGYTATQVNANPMLLNPRTVPKATGLFAYHYGKDNILCTPVVVVPPPVPVVDCVVSAYVAGAWSAWTPISATLEQRTRTLTRTVVTQPSGGGAACPVLTTVETEQRAIVVTDPNVALCHIITADVDIKQNVVVKQSMLYTHIPLHTRDYLGVCK